jgi:Asp-tRNA(Asn)/Glu-tRNA(Gln) amidotransferase B subunit
LVAVWVVNELLPLISGDEVLGRLKFGPKAFADLLLLVASEEISTAAAREVLAEMLEKGGDPITIVDEKGLRTISDVGALDTIIKQVLIDNPTELSAYREGKTSLLGFFIGQTMKASGGSADAKLVRELLQKHL